MGETKERNEQPKIKEPDEVDSNGGLPHDLVNTINAVSGFSQLFRIGAYSEDMLRGDLRKVETFNDYFAGMIGRFNEEEARNGREPYDISASVEAQRAAVPNRDIIIRFDKKIMELREMAEAETIDTKRIAEIVSEIESIVRVKNNKNK